MNRPIARLLVVTLLLVAAPARAAEVPYLTGLVTDTAQLLSSGTARSLAELLRAHEERTGNQIAVLTVASLDGESVEDYAAQVFQEWRLGQRGKDNGLLILVAPNDRRMRIEVGYGLEATVTDARAGRIIRDVMAPRFRDNDYDAGIAEGAAAVVQLLETGAAAALDARPESAPASDGSSFLSVPDMPIAARLLMGAFVFGIIGLFTAIGILTPGVGWFLYFFLIPFWAVFPAVVLGLNGALALLITYLVGFPATKLWLRRRPWYEQAARDLKTKGTASIGGFTIRSGGSGGSGGSWSSGSSSFSGGGGSSGGGGASGSW